MTASVPYLDRRDLAVWRLRPLAIGVSETAPVSFKILLSRRQGRFNNTSVNTTYTFSHTLHRLLPLPHPLNARSARSPATRKGAQGPGVLSVFGSCVVLRGEFHKSCCVMVWQTDSLAYSATAERIMCTMDLSIRKSQSRQPVGAVLFQTQTSKPRQPVIT